MSGGGKPSDDLKGLNDQSLRVYLSLTLKKIDTDLKEIKQKQSDVDSNVGTALRLIKENNEEVERYLKRTSELEKRVDKLDNEVNSTRVNHGLMMAKVKSTYIAIITAGSLIIGLLSFITYLIAIMKNAV